MMEEEFLKHPTGRKNSKKGTKDCFFFEFLNMFDT
jgi:hypothetical protein